MTITVNVYSDMDRATLLGTVANLVDLSWREADKEVGTARVQVALDSTDATLLGRNTYVEVVEGTTVKFVFRVTARTATLSGPEEGASRLLTATGPGVASTLGFGVIAPSAFVASYFDGDMRYFNFASPDYPYADDWDTALLMRAQQEVWGYYSVAGGTPDDWPDPFAYWIWGTAESGGSPSQEAGTNYFRAPMFLAADAVVSFYVCADDAYELWIDGDPVDNSFNNSAWWNTHVVTRNLKAGWHHLAAEVLNAPWFEHPEADYAGFLLCGFTIVGGDRADEVAKTAGGWLVKAYPDEPPGWTVGAILNRLLLETQDRGGLTAWTWTFDDDVDSNGDAWPHTISVSFRIGTTILDVLRQIGAWACDWRVQHGAAGTLELELFPFGTLHTDSGVELAVGVDFESFDVSNEATDTNAVLTRYSNGRYGFYDADPTERRETYAELGVADNVVDVEHQADALMDRYALPTEAGRGRVVPLTDKVPLVDYVPGQEVTVPTMSGGTALATVQAVSVSLRPQSGVEGGDLAYDIETLAIDPDGDA